MNGIIPAISCLMSLGLSMFLWQSPIKIYKEMLLISLFLTVFMIFSFGTMENSSLELEYMPFRMLALCICFSTTSIKSHKVRYLVLSQIFWLWIELFGGISFYYRGGDISWVKIISIAILALGSTLFSHVNREIEFFMMVFWIAIWMFF